MITKQIAINASSGYLRLFVSFCVLFFLTPFIIEKIGKEGYGLWAFIFSILSFFELLDLGFASAVIKYVAAYNAHQEISKRNKIVSTSLLVYSVLSSIGLVGIGILMLIFDQVFSIETSQYTYAKYVLAILAIRILLIGLPFSVFRGILFGVQKIYLINFISLFSSLGYALLACLALNSGYGLLGLAIANFVMAIVENVAYLGFSYLYTTELKLSWSKIDYGTFKSLFSFSSAQFISNLSTVVAYNFDLIIIKFFLPLESIGLYAVPLRIVTFSYILIKQFTNVLTPVFADLHSLGKNHHLRDLFQSATYYAIALSTVITITGAMFAHDILVLWVGKDYSAVTNVLIILLLSMWLTSVHLISGDLLQFCGYHQLYALYVALGIVGNIVACLILINYLGLTGVALGALFAAIVGYFTQFRKVCSIYDIPCLQFISSLFTKILLPGLGQILVLFALKMLIPMDNLWYLMFVSVTGFLAYIVICFFCLDEHAREQISNVFQKNKI